MRISIKATLKVSTDKEARNLLFAPDEVLIGNSLDGFTKFHQDRRVLASAGELAVDVSTYACKGVFLVFSKPCTLALNGQTYDLSPGKAVASTLSSVGRFLFEGDVSSLAITAAADDCEITLATWGE